MTNAAFYQRAAATARRLLDKFGASGAITRTTAGGGYDPATGGTGGGGGGESVQACTAAVVSYDAKEIDGTNIRAGDARVLIAPTATPIAGDVIEVAGRRLVVINVNTVAPAGLVVLHDVQARGL